MSGFDSIQVRFNNTKNITSPFVNTRVVPFINSYFEILKTVVEDVKTEYFWFFANFVDLKRISKFDLDFIPEQHEKDQIHVWYATHPMAGLNKEGNVLLIPTKAFKKQINQLSFLREYDYINYHAIKNLKYKEFSNPNKKYRIHYTDKKITRRFSSFWEAEHGGVVFISDQCFFFE